MFEARHAEKEKGSAEQVSILRSQVQELTDQLQRVRAASTAEQGAHAATQAALQAETIERSRAQQHVAALQERLAENERHRVLPVDN